MRAAVVGHVEWIFFARVDHVPAAGEIVHATDTWEEPGGGGAVAAVQLAKLAGRCDFFTALGEDELGRRAERELAALGVTMHVAERAAATRRAVTFVDDTGERTITTLGERLQPNADDPLPWSLFAEFDAAYFTAGDAAALADARRAKTLVVTSRALDVLDASGVSVDTIVGSERDPAERFDAARLTHPPGLTVLTDGARGGRFIAEGGREGTFEPAPPLGPIVDTYGGGDSFAAGLTFGLGSGLDPASALKLAARCGSACLTGRGAYRGQLTAAGL